MKQKAPSPNALRVADLPQNAPTFFAVRPETSRRQAIAEDMELIALRKLSFEGKVEAEGADDWRLTARLGATVTQPCAVTLDPVTTRIDEDVTRHYQRDFIVVDAPEAEMPEDETAEQLTAWIDPEAVMLEALALALPLYPRAPDAELGEMTVTAPGVAPMRDEDAKPFAALAELKD
ncbi:MAG: YceD family protein, partial [Roseobacter sp.]